MASSATSADDNCYSLTVRPEDLLLACVAYSRPEMLALDKIISLHSQNALVLDADVEQQSKSIADLPVELLLRIRAELQSSLFASLKTEAAAALEQYQAALVEGICPDCFWWNSDVYGSDVWTWVENGYRGACSCAIVGDIDPRSPSETKRRILSKFQGIDIGTRGSWLRAYIQRTYLDEKTSAWNFARGILAQFGCKHRFERPQSQYPSAPATTSPMPTVPEDATTTTAMSGQPEVKKTPRRITSCDFGALVRIFQRPERNESEEPEITLRRLLRELDLKAPADDEPSIALQSSATRFVDKIHRRTACSRHFLAQRGPACNCMDCLALFAAPSASLKSYAFVSSRSLPSSRLSSILPSIPSRRTLTSVAFCAASVAYLVARVVF